MEIKNFTNNSIRLGEYPHCVDVRSIPAQVAGHDYHSSYGVMLACYFPNLGDCKARVVIVRVVKEERIFIVSAKWDRQIAESIKWIEQEFGEVDVIFDSGSLRKESEQ